MIKIFFPSVTCREKAGAVRDLHWTYGRSRAICLWVALAPWLMPDLLHAQIKPEPPVPPLVAPCPGMMKLILLLKEDGKQDVPVAPGKDDASSTHGSDAITWKSVEITKTSDIRLIKATRSDGKTRETWILGNKLFDKTFDGKQVSCLDYHPSFPFFLQTTNTQFYGTEWISLENYKGVVSYEGKKCYHYEKLVRLPSDGLNLASGSESSGNTFFPESRLEAWIDIQSKLPVAVTLSEGVYIYQFAAPPQVPLSPPKEYSDYFVRMKAAADRRQKDAATR